MATWRFMIQDEVELRGVVCAYCCEWVSGPCHGPCWSIVVPTAVRVSVCVYQIVCVCVWVRVIHGVCDSALKFEWIASPAHHGGALPKNAIVQDLRSTSRARLHSKVRSTRSRPHMPSILRAVLFQMQYASLIHITRMSLTHAAHCSWAFEFENAALRMPARAWSPS